MAPSLMLINPWIYDFAAYDLWSKPLGLLCLAAYLRQAGAKVHLIDCLDVHRSTLDDASAKVRPLRRAYGTGKFPRKEIEKPSPLSAGSLSSDPVFSADTGSGGSHFPSNSRLR